MRWGGQCITSLPVGRWSAAIKMVSHSLAFTRKGHFRRVGMYSCSGPIPLHSLSELR